MNCGLSPFWNSLNPANSTVETTVINSFICPSDINRLTFSPAFGPTNYASNAGADANSFAVTAVGPYSGPFAGLGLNSKLSNVIDGTSNTVAFSEIVKGIGTSSNGFDPLKPPASPSRLTQRASLNVQTDFTNCMAQPPSTSDQGGGFPFGAAWWWGWSSQTRYDHVMTPNTWSCDFGTTFNSDSDDDAVTAGSRHPGVVNSLFLDSSVKAIKTSISPAIWWAVATRAGNEVVSADQF